MVRNPNFRNSMQAQYHIHILNYNFDPEPVLKSLIPQIKDRKEDIRIMVWDDGSEIAYRQLLSRLKNKYNIPFIQWNLGHVNVGRSVMRQKFLQYPDSGWKVSIDSDMVPDNDFVHAMITRLTDVRVIYVGQHYYQANPPETENLLHWYYGRFRETAIKEIDPYLNFSSGIFAIHSSSAKDLSFDIQMQSYGHEDTQFGCLLREKQIAVVHIPLKAVHTGLNSFEVFISHQKSALENLLHLIENYPDFPGKLVYWARVVQKIPILRFMLTSASFRQFCLKKLRTNPKQIRYLDLWKLGSFVQILNGDLTSGREQSEH